VEVFCVNIESRLAKRSEPPDSDDLI